MSAIFATVADSSAMSSVRTAAGALPAGAGPLPAPASLDASSSATVDVLDGDADLFVLRPCVNVADCARVPSDAAYDYPSVHGHGRDEVFVRGADLDESLDVGSTKYFRIGVHGWSAHGSTFKLAVTEVPNDRALSTAQTTALDSIFDKCCDATRSCTFWKAHRALSIDPCHSRSVSYTHLTLPTILLV